MNYLIVNARAGRALDSETWQRLLRSAGVAFQVLPPDDDRTWPTLGSDDCLIVAGGDGTVSRYAVKAVASGCTLGILPAGTGNDFARGLGIPLDAEAACQNLRHGGVRHIDIGKIGDDWFLNVAHIGFGSEVSRRVKRDRKHWWGRFAYLRTLVERTRRVRGFKARIRVDNRIIGGRWLQISIANGGFFGGGQRFFQANPFDARLHLIGIRPRAIPTLFILWLLARIRGAAPRNKAIVALSGTQFEILGNSGLDVMADGEPRTHLPATVGVEPAKLRVVMPDPEQRAADVGARAPANQEPYSDRDTLDRTGKTR
jgi:YegS/Rv2252/BmrU family lipid kinase